jgi:uncharacterized membrane protein
MLGTTSTRKSKTRRPVARLGAVATLVLACAGFASAAPAHEDDLGRAALDLLIEKCANCHAPDSDNTKARKHFDDVRDLAHVVDELVLPGDLEFSELWEVVDDGTMPPEDEGGPLTDVELSVIREWILAGAPLPEATSEDPTATPEAPPVGEPDSEPDSEPGTGSRILGWIGKLHPALVHFPIGLLLAAATAEVLRVLCGATWLLGAARFCIQLGCAGAVVAGITGWLGTEYGSQIGRDVGIHRWLAIATVAVSIALLVLSEVVFRKAGAGPVSAYRFILFATAVLVGITGHFGGVLVHGSNYLSW